MPKETITDLANMYDVQVGWQSGSDVQIGVVTHDGGTIVEWLFPEASTGTITVSDSSPSFTGLWGTLDREGINRLIRVLRRARDSAYGADA